MWLAWRSLSHRPRDGFYVRSKITATITAMARFLIPRSCARCIITVALFSFGVLFLSTAFSLTTQMGSRDTFGVSAIEELGQRCSWYQDYVHAHQENLAKLRRQDSDVRLLVYDCRNGYCGGLGDRLGGIASLFYVSVLLERSLVIYHTKPVLLSYTFLPNHDINWDVAELIPNQVQEIYLNLVDKYSLDDLNTLFNAEHADIPIMRVTLNGYFTGASLWNSQHSLRPWFLGGMNRTHHALCGKWRSHTVGSSFALAFNILFRPSEHVLTRKSEMLQALGLDTTQGGSLQYVAIHGRLGGESKTSNNVAAWNDPSRDTLSDIPKFVKCAREKANTNSDTNTTAIILVSDNQEFKVKSSRLHPEIKSITDTLLFHVDRSSGDHKTSLAGSIDAVAEFLILSEADCLVASRSTFSGAASALRNFRGGHACYYHFNSCDKLISDFWLEATPKLT